MYPKFEVHHVITETQKRCWPGDDAVFLQQRLQDATEHVVGSDFSNHVALPVAGETDQTLQDAQSVLGTATRHVFDRIPAQQV